MKTKASQPREDSVERLRSRLQRLEALGVATLKVHESLDPRSALQALVGEAVRLTGASSGSLVLRNPNSNLMEIEAAVGLPRVAALLRLPIGKGITGWVAKEGRTARVADVRKDGRYLQVRPEVRSELAVPLLVGEEVRGVLNVDSEEVGAFSELDQQVLEALAGHAALVIRNTWQFEQARRKTALATALAEIARGMNATLGLEEVLQRVTREAVQLMGAKLSSVLMLGPDSTTLELRASHGAGPDYLGRGRLGLDESLVGVVLRRRKPLQVEDVRSSRLYQGTEVARREGLVSLLSVPLVLGGEACGALNVYSGEVHTYSNEEIQTLSALAELSAIALERARWGERTRQAEEALRRSDTLCTLGLLAAEVAHEIRNPLTVMKMLYHSLDLRFGEDDPRGEDARVIGQKMDVLNRIVERVLDFARHAEPRLEPVSVGVLIEDLRLLIRHKLREQGVNLEVELPMDLPLVRGDPVQLEQAFLNLVLNAVEAMPRGGGLTLRGCRVDSEEGVRGVALAFCDTGAGTTHVPRPGGHRLLSGSTKPQGTGLGLAVVQRVMEAHRGRMTFASEPGRGTTVTLWLPRSD
jgi:signal transduction histidine kinase